MPPSPIETSILLGDARAIPLPDASVQCVVTSPPYWGLRCYGLEPQAWGGDADCRHQWGDPHEPYHKGQVPQSKWKNNSAVADGGNRDSGSSCVLCNAWRGTLGNEPSPELFVAHLVEIFREVRRVLRDDGTVWLNLGDSYARTGGTDRTPSRTASVGNTRRTREIRGDRTQVAPSGVKEKDLVGIPWMVAFALRADGWYLRAENIWAKGISFCPTYAGSSMPESVTDRPARSHETVFLLTKRSTYYYDVHAVKETANRGAAGSKFDKGKTAKHQLDRASNAERAETGTRNLRSVWTINPRPYPGAHFATFPPALVTPCILAGTSAYGACAGCGQPYRRIVEKGAPRAAQQAACGADSDGGYDGQATKDYETAGAQDASATKARILAGMVETRTIGWVTDCACPVSDPVPCVVLDPFSGSGTTAATAHTLGRIGVGVEPNPEYVVLALERLAAAGAF